MADTLPDIDLPAATWIDLYAASGIAVGTKINVHNKGANRVLLATSATEPTTLDGVYLNPVSESAPSMPMQNDAGESGAWAYCANGGAVNVEEA
jgi:hypothetical protein